MRFRTATWPTSLLVWLVVVLSCASMGSSLAAERLTIGQLQQFQNSYHMRSVTVVGKVDDLVAFPPMRAYTKNCFMLYGRAKFVLVDETGSLQVESMGSCYPAAQNLPQAGDQIELTAQIQVYVPEGQTAQVIKATTQQIVVLK